MQNINKNLALQELQQLLVSNFSRTLDYMSNDFNTQQQHMIEIFKSRIFLEEIVEETMKFNKAINWDFSLKNLQIVTNVEELIEVFKLRSDVYRSINYQKEFPDIIDGLNFDIFDKKSAIIFYQNNKKITGTTRLIFDSENKLPTDKIFDFDDVRKQYNKIGELSRLIVKHEQKGLNLEFKYLMKGVYLLFMQNDIDITFLGIKKEHYKLYERFGGNHIIKELDNYGNLDLDALILSWNPAEVSDFFKRTFLR
jgi:predicted GNAT family N-acyltransferase